MKKTIILTIVGLIIIVGTLAGIKVLQIRAMIDQGKKFRPPPEIVTSAPVTSSPWESLLTAVRSLNAVQGVTITAEITGKVVDIAFEAGSRIAAGDLLVQQDISVEKAQLRSAESVAELALIEHQRSKKLMATKVISRSDYDSALAQLTQALAQADNIRAVIAKKTIRAPFAGRLGIRQINLGQVINDGQTIVTLQSLDPIFVNFFIPQQQLALISTGLSVRVSSDPSSGFGGMVVKPWQERDRNIFQIMPEVQQKLHTITGIRMFPVTPAAGSFRWSSSWPPHPNLNGS